MEQFCIACMQATQESKVVAVGDIHCASKDGDIIEPAPMDDIRRLKMGTSGSLRLSDGENWVSITIAKFGGNYIHKYRFKITFFFYFSSATFVNHRSFQSEINYT